MAWMTELDVFAVMLFMASSITMLLLNKHVIVSVFPFTFSLLFLQCFVTIILVAFCIVITNHNKETDGGDLEDPEKRKTPSKKDGDTSSQKASEKLWKALDMKEAVAFVPVSILFMLILHTGLEVFKYISVITFISLRYTTFLLTFFGEIFFLGRPFEWRLVPALVVITLGAAIYSNGDIQFNLIGYLFLLGNIVSMSVYSLYVKYICKKFPFTKFTMSFYSNSLSLVPFLVMAYVFGEFPKALVALSKLTLTGHVFLWASCVTGAFLSVAGFWVQQLFSATSWTLQMNLNKIPTILLSFILFHDKLSPISAVGCTVCLLGGLIWSYASQPTTNKFEQVSSPTAEKNGYQPIPSEDPALNASSKADKATTALEDEERQKKYKKASLSGGKIKIEPTIVEVDEDCQSPK